MTMTSSNGIRMYLMFTANGREMFIRPLVLEISFWVATHLLAENV